MVVWAALACSFLVLTVGNPVREPNGYEYDVKHPGGSSRVQVRSGGEISRSNDYVSDASYVNSHYVRPPYQPNRYGPYQGNFNQPFHGHGQRNAPVYVEHSRYLKPAAFHQAPPHDQFPAYGQGPHGTYPGGRVISQSAVDAGPFYQKPAEYSNPRFVQQVSVDDAIPSYFPNKLEQVPLEQKPTYEQVPLEQKPTYEQVPLEQKPTYEQVLEKYPVKKVAVVPPKPVVVQQVVEPSGYPDTHVSQFPLVSDHVQSPIDQQVLVDEPKEIPIVSQKTLEEKPFPSQVHVNVPSTKSVPIVQQASFDDIPPSSIVQYMNDDEISQVAVNDQPSFGVTKKSPPVQQQVAIDDVYEKPPPSYPVVGKSGPIQENINPFVDDVVIGKSYGSPVVQSAIDDHPSQAVYDSSVEPLFSDADHHAPPYSYAQQPKYRFVPSGPPYERISHSTEIIHGPSYSQYPSAYPQKHIEPNFATVKGPPPPHSVKLPPPPVTKTVIPVQEHVDADIIHTKNPPVIQSVKLPPPPITKSVVPVQQHVDSDIILTKTPQTVKLPPPPPPPVTKTVVQEQIPYAQEHVDSDILLKKKLPVSIKVPPPPPAIKTVVPVQSQQEHIDADILTIKKPPVSVKLPPPPPQSVKLPPPPPVYQSVKLPPPPPAYQSVKLPPPPPVSQSVKLPPRVSQSVKLPPPPIYQPVKFPPPVYKPLKPIPSVKRPFYGYKSPPPSYVKAPPPPAHWNKPYHIHFTRDPPPRFSVKRPYAQAPVLGNPYLKPRVKVPVTKTSPVSYRVKVPVTKTSPLSYRVKAPVVSKVHSVKQPKPAFIPYGPPSIKTPPLAPNLKAPASVKGGASYLPSVKKPYPSIVDAHSKADAGNPHLKYPASDLPPKKYLPISHDDSGFDSSISHDDSGFDSPISHDSGFDSPISHDDSGFDSPISHGNLGPDLPISHAALHHSHDDPGLDSHTLLEAPVLEAPVEKSPFDKYPKVSHAVRIPPPDLKPGSLSVASHAGDKSGSGESSPFDKYPRVSHAVRLSGVLKPTAATTSVPNLFAAVPLLDSDQESHVLPAPKSDSLVASPLSHSVGQPLRIHGSRGHRVNEDYDEPPKQAFPAFPVESALKQRDPVSEKVADSFNHRHHPGPGYLESGHDTDEDDSPRAQSVNDAKSEIDRINGEIGGISFGDRIPRRSRFS